ncbi:MAG TPA: molybdenum cofactor guanylyltransferase [Candidatus Angelobacter sp.]
MKPAKIKTMVDEAITGFVLAGGKSTRMGRNKAELSLHGRTLLETALEAAREVTGEVYILGSPDLYGGWAPAIADVFPGCGPLGGIHAALKRTKTEFNLIIAVDTPFLSGGLLRYVTERALAARAMVTAPEVNAYPQPLCAVYSRAFLPVAERALRAGEFKIVPLFPQAGTLLIGEAELKQVAFSAEMFENLNTPEDLERARRRGPDRTS